MTETTVPAPDSIDVKQALALLEQAVATQGEDFVYNPGGEGSCHYSPNPEIYYHDDPQAQTGCLVGVALRLVGIDLGDLNGSISSLWDVALDNGEVPEVRALTNDAVRVMQRAQSRQDTGATWGEALNTARAVAADLAP
jgi:hypothetical protein